MVSRSEGRTEEDNKDIRAPFLPGLEPLNFGKRDVVRIIMEIGAGRKYFSLL